jgi:hypothetical protein
VDLERLRPDRLAIDEHAARLVDVARGIGDDLVADLDATGADQLLRGAARGYARVREELGESQRFFRFAACERRLRGGGGGALAVENVAVCGVRPERMRLRRLAALLDPRFSYQIQKPTAMIRPIASRDRNSSVPRPLLLSPLRDVFVTVVAVVSWPAKPWIGAPNGEPGAGCGAAVFPGAAVVAVGSLAA